MYGGQIPYYIDPRGFGLQAVASVFFRRVQQLAE